MTAEEFWKILKKKLYENFLEFAEDLNRTGRGIDMIIDPAKVGMSFEKIKKEYVLPNQDCILVRVNDKYVIAVVSSRGMYGYH